MTVAEALLSARCQVYDDTEVQEAFTQVIDIMGQQGDSDADAESLNKTWLDLHAQNKAAYGYEVREAANQPS